MKQWDGIPTGEDRITVYDTLTEAREQFGENYDGLVFNLTHAQAQALLQGKVDGSHWGDFKSVTVPICIRAGGRSSVVVIVETAQ